MRLRALLRLLVPASVMVACADVYSTNLDIPSGGTTTTAVDAGSTTTSTGLVTPEPPPVCPDAIQSAMIPDGGRPFPPVDGIQACQRGGAVCEYGTSPDRSCNRVYSCPSDSDSWRELPGEPCAPAQECPKNAVIAALEGLPCGFDGGISDADELHCNVSDGVCACTTGRGGPDTHARRWVCTRPLAACPLARPNQGQPCQVGMLCDYGSCKSKRGLAMTCLGGVWGATSLDCSL